jgi:threonine synthase
MQYISTRGEAEPIGFSDTVMTGLADDGGLFLPSEIPDLRPRFEELAALSYPDLAFEIIRLYADLPDDVLRELVNRSYAAFDSPDVVPIRRLNGITMLELFHGPTLAFKDVALQFLGNLFEVLLQARGGRLNILTATSGDTGSAAIAGTRGRESMNAIVLYPHGRVTPVQELQMTTVLDDNVHNLAIEGDFDDCQTIVKALFRDLEFKQSYSLGAMNSINWARVLAQIVYYVYAALKVMRERKVDEISFSVPSGNFGNVFAGYVAWRMGLPIRQLILATNENDILSRFFNLGDYSRGEVVPSLSPSMDIQVASNFERYLYYRVGEDPSRLRGLMEVFGRSGLISGDDLSPKPPGDPFCAGSADKDSTIGTIKRVYETFGYVLDPHSAVGVYVGMQKSVPPSPLICLATAHPAKFDDAVITALGKCPARHDCIDALQGKPTRRTVLPADENRVRAYISEHLHPTSKLT